MKKKPKPQSLDDDDDDHQDVRVVTKPMMPRRRQDHGEDDDDPDKARERKPRSDKLAVTPVERPLLHALANCAGAKHFGHHRHAATATTRAADSYQARSNAKIR